MTRCSNRARRARSSRRASSSWSVAVTASSGRLCAAASGNNARSRGGTAAPATGRRTWRQSRDERTPASRVSRAASPPRTLRGSAASSCGQARKDPPWRRATASARTGDRAHADHPASPVPAVSTVPTSPVPGHLNGPGRYAVGVQYARAAERGYGLGRIELITRNVRWWDCPAVAAARKAAGTRSPSAWITAVTGAATPAIAVRRDRSSPADQPVRPSRRCPGRWGSPRPPAAGAGPGGPRPGGGRPPRRAPFRRRSPRRCPSRRARAGAADRPPEPAPASARTAHRTAAPATARPPGAPPASAGTGRLPGLQIGDDQPAGYRVCRVRAPARSAAWAGSGAPSSGRAGTAPRVRTSRRPRPGSGRASQSASCRAPARATSRRNPARCPRPAGPRSPPRCRRPRPDRCGGRHHPARRRPVRRPRGPRSPRTRGRRPGPGRRPAPSRPRTGRRGDRSRRTAVQRAARRACARVILPEAVRGTAATS
ncbi:hypothetical protein SCANM63S_10305 [Streptomyces canarius]